MQGGFRRLCRRSRCDGLIGDDLGGRDEGRDFGADRDEAAPVAVCHALLEPAQALELIVSGGNRRAVTGAKNGGEMRFNLALSAGDLVGKFGAEASLRLGRPLPRRLRI